MGVRGLCVRMCVHTQPRLCEEQSSDHPEVTDATRMMPVPGWHLIGTHQWEHHDSVPWFFLTLSMVGWCVCRPEVDLGCLYLLFSNLILRHCPSLNLESKA